MRKGGFNMYTVKGKSNVTLYKGYMTQFPSKRETEIKKHIATVIGNDISKKMRRAISCVSTMIVHGFWEGED